MHNLSEPIIHNNINIDNVWIDYSENYEKPVLSDFNSARYISNSSKLKVPNEIIKDRFGVIEYLMNKDYETNIKTKITETDFISELIMPEFQDLKKINFEKLY